MTQLLIVQPYMAAYRVPFYQKLAERLKLSGISIVVAAGQPGLEQTLRSDSTKIKEQVSPKLKRWPLPFLGAKLQTYSGLPLRSLSSADGVIFPLEATCLNIYHQLLRRAIQRPSPAIGVWGHIGSYVGQSHPIDQLLETRIMRSSNHVFAYTRSGAEQAVSRGVDWRKVTNVENSVETSRIADEIRSISAFELTAFQKNHKLVMGKTLVFVGGLDASKRIAFLAAALEKLWNLDPEVRLLVIGAGKDQSMLHDATKRRQVVILGYQEGRTKALAYASSDAVLMPGRVGLIAVEAMAVGLPILTTAWPFHAPEFEYLSEGYSKFTLRNEPTLFAHGVTAFLRQSPSPGRLALGGMHCHPTIENMVNNFEQGVLTLLSRS